MGHLVTPHDMGFDGEHAQKLGDGTEQAGSLGVVYTAFTDIEMVCNFWCNFGANRI